MKLYKMMAIVLAVTYGCMGYASGATAGEKTTIILASPFQPGHILSDAGLKFKEIIEQESQGGIKVEVQSAAGSEEDVNIWCSEGKVQMQATGGEPLEISAPKYFFFNAPYVMEDFEHFMRVWNSDLGDEAKTLVEKNGNMKYLGIIYRGLRQMTSKKPIYTPADVTGLKLRLPTVPTWIAVWEAMGAAPVPVPLTGLYDALKDGTAEASEGDVTQIMSFMLYEVQSHISITNHLVQTGGILINKAFFDDLPQEQQEMVVKAADMATHWANETIKAGEAKVLEELQAKGMEVVLPDAKAFQEKGKPTIEALFKKEWSVTTWENVLSK